MAKDYYLACDECRECYRVAEVGGGVSFHYDDPRCVTGINQFIERHIMCGPDIRLISEDTMVAGDFQEVEWPGMLNWYYGPTETDPEPSKMWHNGCGGEVMFLEDGYICRKCGQQSEG